MNAFLSGTFGKGKHRQRSERLAGGDSPSLKDICKLRAGGKHRDGQRFKKAAFLLFRYDRASGQRARHDPRRFHVCGNGNVRVYSDCLRLSEDATRNHLLRSEKPREAGEIQEKRIRRQVLHT